LGVNKDRVDKLTEEIIAKESNIEKAALRYMDDVYRRTLYKAEVAMSAGATTLPQAIDMATRDFLNAGINCIEYKDGRRVNIADYVQMALRTAATRSYLNGAAAKRAELGIDTVLVSQYGACSETCLPWQGRVYIDDVWGVFEGERSGEMGKRKNGKWYPLLSVAIKGGLYHPNCRHSHTTWIEGVSKLPTALDPKKTGENYKLEQQQRKLEREIRKLKRLNTGSLSAGNEKLYQDQIKAKQKELREFVNKHSDVLRRDYWRERVYDISVDKTTDDGTLSDRKRVTGALDPYSKKAAEHANRYYEAVRRMKTDTLRIAENTGYKPKNISKVKSHLFMEKHDLGRDELDFFDADYHIAQSWQRLIDGKNIQESDIVLLKHEIAERALMLRGYSYQEAHNRANKRYNYTELLNPK
jgi:hypothetical protein